MKKLFCIIAVICGILIVNISYPKYSNAWEIGAGFSPARHHYQVEYLKPWQGVSYIYITFNNKNISSKEMDYIEKDFHITKTLLDLASKKTYPEMLYFIGNIEEPFRNILIQKISRTVEI